MKLSFKLLSLLVAVTSVVSQPTESPSFTCGNELSPEAVLRLENDFTSVKNIVPGVDVTANPITVDVVFHVIAKDQSPVGGNIPDALIQAQITVLNQDFRQTGITWRLVAIDRSVNPSWYDGVGDGNTAELQMKQALRKGGPGVLNVYTVGKIVGAPPGYLLDGFATFPFDFMARPWKDGVVLAHHALPGGPYAARGLGRTMAHEAGHWVGLYHTFQGGCTAPGDYVDDTPFEASPASGCPAGRDTCPQPGVDPINNVMDYTDDACRNTFSPGQVSRLRQAMTQFRGFPR